MQCDKSISPTLLGNDDEDKNDADKKPRIVFIERLMGLHVSAPLRQNDGQPAADEKESESEILGPKNPLDNLNAKWVSRNQKWSGLACS